MGDIFACISSKTGSVWTILGRWMWVRKQLPWAELFKWFWLAGLKTFFVRYDMQHLCHYPLIFWQEHMNLWVHECCWSKFWNFSLKEKPFHQNSKSRVSFGYRLCEDAKSRGYVLEWSDSFCLVQNLPRRFLWYIYQFFNVSRYWTHCSFSSL